MSDENVPSIPAAEAPHPDTNTSPAGAAYDRLLDTTCMLECVLAVVEQETEEASASSRLQSAEIVLRRSIAALHEIGGQIEERELAIATLRQAVHS